MACQAYRGARRNSEPIMALSPKPETLNRLLALAGQLMFQQAGRSHENADLQARARGWGTGWRSEQKADSVLLPPSPAVGEPETDGGCATKKGPALTQLVASEVQCPCLC